jgi:sigma-B regulation protein RsbU (phosphoserine phosphatase)
MTMVKGFLKALASESLEPARILSEANALFYENVERGNFISMVYGILDSQSGEFTFARAGHNPILYLLGKSAAGQWLSPQGVGIGLLPAKEFRAHITQEKIKMRTEETLILYTDGYPEAMNEKSEQFGEENLKDFIRQQLHLPATDIVFSLEKAIKKWEGNRTAMDDRTMVVIKKIS